MSSKTVPSEEVRSKLIAMGARQSILQARISDAILDKDHIATATEYLSTHPQASYARMVAEVNLASGGNCVMTLVMFHRIAQNCFPFQSTEGLPTTIEEWRKLLPRGVLQRVTKALCAARHDQAAGMSKFKKDKAYNARMVKLLTPRQEQMMAGTLETFDETYEASTHFVNMLNSWFGKYCVTHESIWSDAECADLKELHDATCEVCKPMVSFMMDQGIEPNNALHFVTGLAKKLKDKQMAALIWDTADKKETGAVKESEPKICFGLDALDYDKSEQTEDVLTDSEIEAAIAADEAMETDEFKEEYFERLMQATPEY